jgi:hypothetical protein
MFNFLKRKRETKMEFNQENFDKLIADLATATAENETLSKVNDGLVLKIEELTAVKDVKTQDDLAKKVTEFKKVSAPDATFEVEGVKYKFISPVFTFKNERIIAADVLNDTEKLAELVAAKVGTIKKV